MVMLEREWWITEENQYEEFISFAPSRLFCEFSKCDSWGSLQKGDICFRGEMASVERKEGLGNGCLPGEGGMGIVLIGAKAS